MKSYYFLDLRQRNKMERVGPITSEILDACISEIRKEESQQKINSTIIDPLVDHIMGRIQPYILVTSCTFVIIILLSIVIIYLILSSGKAKIS